VSGSLVALRDVVVGSKSPGRVVQLTPREGDSVRAGQVVAVMDGADQVSQVQSAQANVQAALTREQQAQAAVQQARQALMQAQNAVRSAQTNKEWTDKSTTAALETARAQVKSARENLSIVKQGARPQERAQAQQQVNAAKAAYDKARADLRRYQALFREQVVAQSQLDQYQAAADSAEAQYNGARENLSLVQEGARPEDIRRAQLAVDSAEEGLRKAEADRATVRIREEDVRSARSGVTSAQANIRSAEAGVRAARASTAQARAALRIAQEAVSNIYVRSPINGYVAERRAEPGQQLGAGGPILRIVDPASVYFQAVVSESQIGEISVGMPATVTVDAIPGRKFSGRISRVLPVASAAARSFTVRIDLAGDPRMRPQMFARGAVVTATRPSATLAPKDAVIADAREGSKVFVVGPEGKAVARKVQVGITTPAVVEITNGAVSPGDKVVVAGQTTLQDGDQVKVQ
jgi:RND family efflux transporter MFP subunit